VIYTTDTSGNKVAGSQLDCKGIVSGANITNIVYKAGNDAGNSIGAIVECAPTAAWANDTYSWGSAHANQDGSLIGSVVRTALGQTAATGAGWTALGVVPSTVTALGNRSYSVIINGSDQTGTLSNGMRLLMQRTVAAPTQSTSLNGTTQYYSKASPTGVTFTAAYTASSWVKLASYNGAINTIISRDDTTNGFSVHINASGQLESYFRNGAGFTRAASYQSVPLNKWVHVAIAVTPASQTFIFYMDGVAVPGVLNGASVSTMTQPAAAVALQVGACNSSAFFKGSLAQTSIFSAALSAATILAMAHQTLSGSETSEVSAYSFNNSINDLNANANNLTANGSAVATNADSPFAQAATAGSLEYAIVMANSFSTNTTLTVQVPEGCALPTSGGVSSMSYSTQAVPYGFPKDKEKWRVNSLWPIRGGMAGAASTWYEAASVNIPIGSWTRGYQSDFVHAGGTTVLRALYTALSTTSAATSEDGRLNALTASESANFYCSQYRQAPYVTTTATVNYLNYKSGGSAATSITMNASGGLNEVFAENAHL